MYNRVVVFDEDDGLVVVADDVVVVVVPAMNDKGDGMDHDHVLVVHDEDDDGHVDACVEKLSVDITPMKNVVHAKGTDDNNSMVSL